MIGVNGHEQIFLVFQFKVLIIIFLLIMIVISFRCRHVYFSLENYN